MQTHPNLFMLEQYLYHHPGPQTLVMLSTGVEAYLKINWPLITHLEAESNYTRIHFFENPRPLLVRNCLKEFENKLPADCFLRIHRGDIINLFMITHYFPNERKVQLLDNTSLLVAPVHVHEFREKFQFWFGQLHSDPDTSPGESAPPS